MRLHYALSCRPYNNSSKSHCLQTEKNDDIKNMIPCFNAISAEISESFNTISDSNMSSFKMSVSSSLHYDELISESRCGSASNTFSRPAYFDTMKSGHPQVSCSYLIYAIGSLTSSRHSLLSEYIYDVYAIISKIYPHGWIRIIIRADYKIQGRLS